MIRQIVKDVLFLGQKSELATKEDIGIIDDLVDTLRANLESCLSLTGFRKTTRYEIIEVEYLDRNFKKHKETFSGFTAQIIQHEVDHFDGIII